MSKPIKPGASNRIEDYNRVELLFPSDYITAADLREKDAVITIIGLEPRHELQRTTGKDYRPVIRMKGTEKLWVLNKTNAKSIAALHGKEVTGWVGKQVTIYPTTAQFGGKDVDCIRVRNRIPQTQGARAVANDAPTSTDERQPGEDG